MGHYDDDYEYDRANVKWSTNLKRKEVREKLEYILREYASCADDEPTFRMKIKEAIFWLYGEMPEDE